MVCSAFPYTLTLEDSMATFPGPTHTERGFGLVPDPAGVVVGTITFPSKGASGRKQPFVAGCLRPKADIAAKACFTRHLKGHRSNQGNLMQG